MRKILLIDGGKATPLNETKFTEESKLQDYLEEYPSLIPLADIVEGAADLLCIGREVGAGSGSIDLLCIDNDSLLTIVETKLRRNREARREVVGQIIEYASYVSQWTADDVYRIANEYFAKSEKAPQSYKGKTLDEVIREIVGDEFSDEAFRARIGQNLRDGRIRLVITVDELIEPLRATVTFLNSHSNFDILLLQVTDFEESETKKVLVPLLFGYATKSTDKGSRETKHWDEDSFLADTKERCEPKIADNIIKLYEFTQDNADKISWGKGATYGSFTFRKIRQGMLVSIFAITSAGSGWVCFGEFMGKAVKEEAIQTFRAKLNEIPGINIPEEATKLGKFPSFTVEALTKADNLKNFQDAVLALCQQIES
ncbi:MAG: hypothetical protein H8E40_01870 [Chloroflexi bacterium]|nr:hypothetical protein [Chloroflexota bacterium]